MALRDVFARKEPPPAELITDLPVRRWPGLDNKFALFGEVMISGVFAFVLSLGVITLPIALAVSVRHLRRYLEGEDSSLTLIWRDLRAGFIGSLWVGTLFWMLAAGLVTDLALAQSGLLPGGPAINGAVLVLLAVLPVALLRAVNDWRPDARWSALVRRAPRALAVDPLGSLYLVVAVALTVVLAWQLLPLLVLALGCVVLAVVAIAARRQDLGDLA